MKLAARNNIRVPSMPTETTNDSWISMKKNQANRLPGILYEG